MPGQRESLAFLDDASAEDGPVWALVPTAAHGADYDPLDTALAEELIKSRLRAWLLEGGWQVQVAVSKGKQAWRLADCLSVADGGGDRLDDAYPQGEQELAVLCDSVQAVAHRARPA